MDLTQTQSSDLAKLHNLGWEMKASAIYIYLFANDAYLLDLYQVRISHIPCQKRKPQKQYIQSASCPCHRFLIQLIIGSPRVYNPWYPFL